MGTFAVGQVIVLPFPFSDLQKNKIRPALLLASVGRGDWIVCQITSKAYFDALAIGIADEDFVSGNLQRISYARASKLFTANESLFSGVAGELNRANLQEIKSVVVEIINC